MSRRLGATPVYVMSALLLLCLLVEHIGGFSTQTSSAPLRQSSAVCRSTAAPALPSTINSTTVLHEPPVIRSGWDGRLQELIEYKRNYGDCLVPRRYEENPTLGNWVNKQRQLYRKFHQGEPSSMTQERIHLLNELGFSWDASGKRDTGYSQQSRSWWKRYKELSQYLNDSDRTLDSLCSTSPLGMWVHRQRNEYEALKDGSLRSTLTKERVDALRQIDFEWKARRERAWETHVIELVDYKEKHGDCIVPISYKENPSLAHWVSNMRKQYNLRAAGKPSLLNDDRIQQLDELGFVWNRWEYEFRRKGIQV